MKKLILITLLSFGFAFSAQNRLYNEGIKHFKLFDDSTVALAEASVTTSGDVWVLLSTVRVNDNQILGTIGLSCEDASGTDSVLVDLVVDANYSQKGNGEPEGAWVPIDSVSISVDGGASTQVLDTITVADDPIFYRFRLRNNGDVSAEAASCTDVWFNPRSPLARKYVR